MKLANRADRWGPGTFLGKNNCQTCTRDEIRDEMILGRNRLSEPAVRRRHAHRSDRWGPRTDGPGVRKKQVQTARDEICDVHSWDELGRDEMCDESTWDEMGVTKWA